jgi:hypothetical protein
MRGKFRLGLALFSAAMITSLALATSSPATITIGSNLRALPSPDAGICMLTAMSRSCTDAQSSLAPTHVAKVGLTASATGTIVRWRVLSGTPSPNTAAVKLRLRVLRGDEPIGDASSFVDLPPEAGVHGFSTLLPIDRGDRLAVESVVKGTVAGPSYVPIAHFEPGAGTLAEWTSPLFRGLGLSPDTTSDGIELLLSADLDLDRAPPRTKLTYPNRQDFLAKKTVLVHFRCNEDATVFASGQLEIPAKHTIYGIFGVKKEVDAGEKVALRLRVPMATRKAALIALGNGKRVLVKVTLSATDAVGNRSGATVATIKPKL